MTALYGTHMVVLHKNAAHTGVTLVGEVCEGIWKSVICVLCSEWFIERLADETSETLEAFSEGRSYAPVSSQGVLIHWFLQLAYYAWMWK